MATAVHVLVPLATLIAAFAAVLGIASFLIFRTQRATPTADQYAAGIGLWVPHDAQHFQAHGEGWQDWRVWVDDSGPTGRSSTSRHNV